MAAKGHIIKALKSLETTLKDKMRIYNSEPDHPSIWKVAHVHGDIALKHAVRCINTGQLETAEQYLKIV